MDTVDIIVPCYNEETVIGLFYDKCRKAVDAIDDAQFRFIFVDDGSRDETLSWLRRLSQEQQDVHYISFSRNFGKEAAMYAGLKASSGDYAVIMDADLQDPPELLAEMLKVLREGGYDCAASRRVSRTGEPRLRSFCARAFYKFMACSTSCPPVDGARDFRMMSRRMVEAVLSLSETDRFSKGLFQWVGFKTYWFSYENLPRAGGKTKWSFFSLAKYAVTGIVSFSTVPLAVIALVGAGLLILSAWSFADGVLLGLSSSQALLTALLFVGGVLEMSLAVVAEYIGRIHMSVKERPMYIVQDTDMERSCV